MYGEGKGSLVALPVFQGCEELHIFYAGRGKGCIAKMPQSKVAVVFDPVVPHDLLL